MPQGVVAKINCKDWPDPDTGETLKLYSFKLDGDNDWHRTGTINPSKFGVKEGAFITFSLNDKGKPNTKTIKVTMAEAPVRSPPSRVSSSTKDDYWKDKEAKDVAKDARYQSVDIPRMTFCGAQDTAVRVVELAIAQGALTLGSKANAKLGIIMSAINEVAVDLFNARMNAPNIKVTNTTQTSTKDDDDNESHTEGMGPDDDE